jgi:hypothetical protein
VIRTLLLSSLGVAALGAATTSAAQVPSGTPSVDIRPEATGKNAPAGGDWFVAEAAPGQTAKLSARLFNPADIPQTVRLFIADLVYGTDSVPRVSEPPFKDVGTWGAFGSPSVTVPPHSPLIVPFTVTPPQGAEPGDHVGIVVAEHQAETPAGGLPIVKRVAIKLYVTVPGDAARAFSIRSVTATKDSSLFPRELSVRVVLSNDGRVRLQPVVRVNGHRAAGSGLLMTKAYEPYIATVPIPWYGGPVRLRVDATTTIGAFAGPARQAHAMVFVVPWHVLAALALAVGLAFAVRFLLSRRTSKYGMLQADLARLERLMAQQAERAEPQRRDDMRRPPSRPDVAAREAIKRARRAGDDSVAAKIAAIYGVDPSGTDKRG